VREFLGQWGPAVSAEAGEDGATSITASTPNALFALEHSQKKAHPVVPGSSTYRGGGRNLKRGWVSSFSGALSCLSACRWQFYGLLASVETPIARSHSMPSCARRRRPPHGILIPHIGLPGTTG
jgi:hypothetical protein